jgi:hypothetical protein
MVAGRSMSDLPERLLCIEANCIGTLNERRYCNVCGKSLDGEYDPLRAEPEVDVKSRNGLTQFQFDCERLLTERLAQVGSRISNRTVKFYEPPGGLTESFLESLLPRLYTPRPMTGGTITGTVEGTDIEIWINNGYAQFRSSLGSGEFWVYAGMSLAGLDEEFVDAVFETLQEVKARAKARMNPEVLESLNEKKISTYCSMCYKAVDVPLSTMRCPACGTRVK